MCFESEAWACPECRGRYPLRDGIVSFNESDRYYGELPRHEMQELLALAEGSGWKDAATSYLQTRNPELIKTIMDPRRTSWRSLLDLSGQETVLDFGCGLGGASALLAEQASQVVSLDGCYDRIRFLSIRKKQDDLHNIHLICNGTPHRLPFADQSFDLIILNMVFPYLYVTLPRHDPAAADQIIMTEIVRTLKHGGRLYLSIRNGRSLHQLRSRFSSRDDFVYHGYAYYKRLLAGCSIDRVHGYWLIPNYKYPEHFVPLEGQRASIASAISRVTQFSSAKKSVAAAISRLGGLSFLAESISLLGTRVSPSGR